MMREVVTYDAEQYGNGYDLHVFVRMFLCMLTPLRPETRARVLAEIAEAVKAMDNAAL